MEHHHGAGDIVTATLKIMMRLAVEFSFALIYVLCMIGFPHSHIDHFQRHYHNDNDGDRDNYEESGKNFEDLGLIM